MKERGRRRLQRVRAALEGVIFQGCRGELTGRRRLMIQGCDRILDFGERCIRLSMREGEVREMAIQGESLRCLSYYPDAIVIVGVIEHIELLGGEGQRED